MHPIQPSGHYALVHERAEVVEIEGLEWSAGAPIPVVVASEYRTLFAFETREARIQTAEFIGCTCVRFGFPNDEVLDGHPLWGRGLTFYRAHEVIDSTWLADLRAIESVHDQAPETPFAESSHFVLTFHDSTLEAVARRIALGNAYETVADALAAMSSAVTQDL